MMLDKFNRGNLKNLYNIIFVLLVCMIVYIDKFKKADLFYVRI